MIPDDNSELKLVPDTDPELSTVQPDVDFAEWEGRQEELIDLVNRMGQKMLRYQGVGLSANQVGIKGRIFVMRTAPQITACINPRIVDASEEKVLIEEGCLSFPGLHVRIKRPAHIRVRYQTVTGETITEKLTGLTARVFQHELDHLNGINFIDRAGSLAKNRAVERWNKLRKNLNLKKRYFHGT
jgi:peptide deformylase